MALDCSVARKLTGGGEQKVLLLRRRAPVYASDGNGRGDKTVNLQVKTQYRDWRKPIVGRENISPCWPESRPPGGDHTFLPLRRAWLMTSLPFVAF